MMHTVLSVDIAFGRQESWIARSVLYVGHMLTGLPGTEQMMRREILQTFKRKFSEGFAKDVSDLAVMCEFYETDNIDIEIEDPVKGRKLTINIKFTLEEKR